MEIYELSIQKKVSFAQIASILSQLKQIPSCSIGTETDYYHQLGTNDQLTIGISILYQDKGYQSLVNLTFTHEMSDIELIEMTYELAKVLNTNVVIGDVTSNSEFAIGEYLVIHSDRTYQKAYEKTNNELMFDVNPCADKVDISELLSLLKTSESPALSEAV